LSEGKSAQAQAAGWWSGHWHHGDEVQLHRQRSSGRGGGRRFCALRHGAPGWSVETMRGLVAATVGTVPLVRVAATEYHFMGRVLDVGAMGLMIPMGSAGPASARARPSPSSVQPLKRRGGCAPAASAVWPAVSTSGCTRKRSAAASTSCATMQRRRNDRLWDRGGTRAGGVLA